MANTKAAQKALKQNMKRHTANVARKSATKTCIKKVHQAIEAGKSTTEVQKLLSDAASALSRAGSKQVIHKNTASRKLSRLSHKVHLYFQSSSEA